ncbi:hypothetical protein [Lactococcus formosensis]|uniref:hypothetical protein n=1 Tax=Lactococcus formosensis TaxID=1281486 RepID=UPI003267CA3A
MAAAGINKELFISELLQDLICGISDEAMLGRFTYFIQQDIYKNYDVIALYVYKMSSEDLVKLESFFKDNKNQGSTPYGMFTQELFQRNFLSYDEIGTWKKLGGFERNINLSMIQREFILDNVKHANEEAEKAKKVAETAGEIKTKIYSEFLGILAIFTALTFSMMGSIQLLGNVFNSVKALDDKALGFAMITSSVYLLVIYLLIIVMFVGVKKIIGNGNDYEFNIKVTRLVFLVVIILFLLGIYFKTH